MKRTIIILTSIFSVDFCFDATISATNRKQNFTQEEDDLIIDGMARGKTWGEIAQPLKRNPTRVSERWMNYLNPAIAKAPWTDDEDRELLRFHEMFGSKWAKICVCLGTKRANNDVKNRYYWLMRKIKSQIRWHASIDPEQPHHSGGAAKTDESKQPEESVDVTDKPKQTEESVDVTDEPKQTEESVDVSEALVRELTEYRWVQDENEDWGPRED